MARPRAIAAIVVVLAPYLGLLALFVLGVAFLPSARLPLLLLGFLAFYVLLHVATHGYPRYRIPSLPVLFVVAAHGWAAWRSRPRTRPERPMVVASALAALVLAASVAPSLHRWATRPWPPAWFANAAESGEGGGAAHDASDQP